MSCQNRSKRNNQEDKGGHKMKEYAVVAKTFVKSRNKTSKIYSRYFYSLVAFILFSVVFLLLLKQKALILPLLKSVSLSLIIASALAYFINIVFKNTNFIDIYRKDNVHIIALIIGLFGIDIKLSILTLAILISLVIKKIYKGIDLSASLYGILLILLYKYYNSDLVTPLISFKAANYFGTYQEVIKKSGGIISYLIGIDYLSPCLSIIAFIYLFHKKSVKYGIVLPYVGVFSLIMFMYGLFNNMNIWFLFFELTTGSILFLTLYTLTDYKVTPTILEGQIIYGIIAAIISAILRFIIPELSIVVTFIVCPLILTRIIERISPKLKYNPKFYHLMIFISMLLVVMTTVGLIFLK